MHRTFLGTVPFLVLLVPLAEGSDTCPPGSFERTRIEFDSFGPSLSWTDQLLEVPRFDPQPGQTLVRVELSLETILTDTLGVENKGSFPCPLDWTERAEIELHGDITGPGGSHFFVGTNGFVDLDVFDGTIDYDGPSGETIPVSTTGVIPVTYTDPSVLANDFTGPGSVVLMHSATTSFGGSCPSFALNSNAMVELRLGVTYVYCQACPTGSTGDSRVASAVFGPAPEWSNEILQVAQFEPGAGQTLTAAEISVVAVLTDSLGLENRSPVAACSLDWSDFATVSAQTGVPGLTQVDLLPQAAGQADLGVFDGAVDFGGTSGVTIPVSAPFTFAATITDPAVLAAYFTGDGFVVFTHSADGEVNTSGTCGPFSVLSTASIELTVTVTYQYCQETLIGTAFCPGDGSGTACPCGNSGALEHGCENSSSTGGARLQATGDRAANSVVLHGTDLPRSAIGIAIRAPQQAAGGAGKVFGDGLLCVGTPVVRCGTSVAAKGHIEFPLNHAAGSGVFNYQIWYRDKISFCTIDRINLSNGLTIVWP